MEHLSQPEDHIEEILRRVKPEYISRTYGITDWKADDYIDFLEKLAKKAGRLLNGGEPDISTVGGGLRCAGRAAMANKGPCATRT